jgi:7-cyano-7-deazaguanine reductase
MGGSGIGRAWSDRRSYSLAGSRTGGLIWRITGSLTRRPNLAPSVPHAPHERHRLSSGGESAGSAGIRQCRNLWLLSPTSVSPPPAPTAPDEAVLDRVPNPHKDMVYLVRLSAPEFTVLCAVTGQPDFAHLVIDYVPKAWLIESSVRRASGPGRRIHPGGHHWRGSTTSDTTASAAVSSKRSSRLANYAWAVRDGVAV